MFFQNREAWYGRIDRTADRPPVLQRDKLWTGPGIGVPGQAMTWIHVYARNNVTKQSPS
jgi:hypothetical protein